MARRTLTSQVELPPRPFEPRYGDRPLWALIVDHLDTMQVGDIVTDDQLEKLLPDGASWRTAFLRAVTHIEDNRRRTFDRVRTVGYRMVEAVEHDRLARGQHRKSRRAMHRAFRKAHSADRSRMTLDERRRMDDLELHIAAHESMIRRLDRKVAQETRERKAETASLSEKVDALTELLRRHGIVAEEGARV